MFTDIDVKDYPSELIHAQISEKESITTLLDPGGVMCTQIFSGWYLTDGSYLLWDFLS